MTVSSTTRRAGPYATNGTTTAFPFAFKVFSETDLVVYKIDTTSEAVDTLALTTDYTVTLTGGGAGGGEVVISPALAAGYTIQVVRSIPVTQETDLINQGAWLPEVIEDQHDREVMLIQELADDRNHSLRVPASENWDDDDGMFTPLAGGFVALDSDKRPVCIPAESGPAGAGVQNVSRTLVDGQLLVTWTGLNVTAASFYVVGPLVDAARLYAPDDYVAYGANAITLTSSFPAGTKIVAVYRDAEAGGDQASRLQVEIADDGVHSFVPVSQSGFLAIKVVGQGDVWGRAVFFASDGPATPGYMTEEGSSSSVDFSVELSPPTGTTGVDGRLTVSAVTDGDGILYVENRLGATVTVFLLIHGD